MIIIGELLNSTRKQIKKAIEEKNIEHIQEIAVNQAKKGADFIDVNAGAFIHKEVEYLNWLVKVVQEVVDKPLALDSPDPEALESAIKLHKGTPMINSITAEKERYDLIMPLVKNYEAKVIALCMGDDGMPETAEERLKVADKLINNFERDGIPLSNVFLDPLIKPISVNGEFGPQVLDTITGIIDWGTDVHITCGLSNISFGLPKRTLLNQAFLVLAMGRGLDSAIIDPLDNYLMKLIKASELLLNKDPFSAAYIKAARAGELD
jgi:cobalamin-dependent methionine synthase I